jgi:hypothetical protein
VYYENEVCSISVKKGSFQVRAQRLRLLLNEEKGLLAKFLNYCFEWIKKLSSEKYNVEVIGLLFDPELVQDPFDF